MPYATLVSPAFKRRSRPNAQTGLFIDDEEHALGCALQRVFSMSTANRCRNFNF